MSFVTVSEYTRESGHYWVRKILFCGTFVMDVLRPTTDRIQGEGVERRPPNFL